MVPTLADIGHFVSNRFWPVSVFGHQILSISAVGWCGGGSLASRGIAARVASVQRSSTLLEERGRRPTFWPTFATTAPLVACWGPTIRRRAYIMSAARAGQRLGLGLLGATMPGGHNGSGSIRHATPADRAGHHAAGPSHDGSHATTPGRPTIAPPGCHNRHAGHATTPRPLSLHSARPAVTTRSVPCHQNGSPPRWDPLRNWESHRGDRPALEVIQKSPMESRE